MVLTERDYIILQLLYDFDFLLGRQLKILAGFNSQRVCDRRLQKLRENELIERKRILYGVAGIYTITKNGKIVIDQDTKHTNTIRLDLIKHNISTIDAAIYILHKYNITISDITTEKHLHKLDGYGKNRHRPDFIFFYKDKVNCVEVELSLKEKSRLKANLERNFLDYDAQIWIIPKEKTRIRKNVEQYKDTYNLYILDLEGVQEYVNNL